MTYNSEKLQELIDSTTDLKDCINISDVADCEDEDELREALQELINNENIIYYSNAIEYLRENDPSLKESLELAHNMGYEAKSLDSELLATILYQDALNSELAELDLSECFEEVEE